jgi:DnaJ-class molecular chaperone
MTDEFPMIDEKTVPCKRCDGTGQTGTKRKRTCKLCHGDGTVNIILIASGDCRR